MLHKIKTIYVKELTETLRDRRTLFAMIGVPLVLYPMLMFFAVQIKLFETATLQAEQYVIAVDDEAARERLSHILEIAAQSTETQPAGATSTPTFAPTTTSAPATQPGGLRIVVAQVPTDQLGESVHARVVFEPNPPTGPVLDRADRMTARIIYRKTKVRSDMAAHILMDRFDAYRRWLVDRSVAIVQHRLNKADVAIDLRAVLDPVNVETETVDTQREVGGHLLSMIVPFILILMTATGAVYPAIDLTAGERERGTLETLLATPVTPLVMTTGKFLVVTTIAVVTSLLNVASIAGMLWVGDVMRALAPGDVGTVPFYTIPIIVLSLIPYAVLTAAMMIAVCSVARSFKEAQNYVTPLIVLILVPAGVGTIQTVRLEGAMLVAPIANVTLFVRDLLQENTTLATAAVVLGSTTLYAAAAVAAATRLFGQEAVLFADAAPLKAMFARKFMKPRAVPSTAMALVTVAVIFPAVFVGQLALQRAVGGNLVAFIKWMPVTQVGIFVAVPVALCAFNKINVASTFRLRVPPVRFWIVGLLLGSSTAVLAVAFSSAVFHDRSIPSEFTEMSEAIAEAFGTLGLPMVLLAMAVTPAVCEELLFRGYLLSGLASSMRKWGTILVVGLVFGAFHFSLLKFPITAALGMLLAYVCWQSRSVWPGMIVHVMHNGILMLIGASVMTAAAPALTRFRDLLFVVTDAETQSIEVRGWALGVAAMMFVCALLLCATGRASRLTELKPAT